MTALREQRAQASVEAAAGGLAVLAAGLASLQLLAAGYAAAMADHAAEAGALALANGRPVASAAKAAVPGWPDGAIRVAVRGGEVEVTLRPPSPFGFVRRRLEIKGHAAVRPPPGAA